MPDDPEQRLPPTGENDSAPRPGRKVTCEFCECSLTTAGEVLRFSDKAKKYRHHDDELEKRDKRIAELESAVRDVNAKLAEHAAAAGGRRDSELLL